MSAGWDSLPYECEWFPSCLNIATADSTTPDQMSSKMELYHGVRHTYIVKLIGHLKWAYGDGLVSHL